MNMRKRISILCAVLYVATILVAAPLSNGSEMIPIDSWLYDGLDTLFYEQAKVIPFTTRPYTADEFWYHLDQINPDKLSGAGKGVYQRVVAGLPKVSNEKFTARFDATAIISPELYLNSNRELIRDAGSQHYLYGYERGYEERLPLLSVPIKFWAGNYLYSEIDIDIKQHPGMGVYPSGDFPKTGDAYINWSNIPFKITHMLQHFPDNYYMSFGDRHWNFYLGSSEYSVGLGATGTFVLSKEADKIPAARFSWYNDWFRYNFTYISLNPAVGNSGAYSVGAVGSGMAMDLPALTARYRIDNPNAYGTDDGNGNNQFQDYMDPGLYPYKGYLVHSMEFRFLWDYVYLGISEAAVYGRAVPELFMALPLAFWHNGNNGEQTNSLLGFDLQIAAGNKVQIYGSAVLDQYAMKHEDDSDDPAAWGYLAGATTNWNVGKGYITGGVEYLQTNQWLYTHKYWMETPTVAQRNTALTRGGYDVRLLGYHKGNDYSQVHLSAGYTQPGHFDVTASFNYGKKGPFDVFVRKPGKTTNDTDTFDWKYPTVAAMPIAVQKQVALVGHYYLCDGITFGGYFYYTHIDNYKNEANNTMKNVEFTVSASIDPIKAFLKK